MNTGKTIFQTKWLVVSAVLSLSWIFSASASAAFIDFNTDQGGTPYVGLGDSFVANEYNGVIITDSDPSVGQTEVNLINPVNSGTAISGYYVNVGAFAGTATWLNLDFTSAVDVVGFDFATPQGVISVEAFDEGGASMGVFNYIGGSNFVNQAGFDYRAGHVTLSGIGNISSLMITPSANETLVIDNLRYNPAPVPLPASFPLFVTGLMGLAGLVRRHRRA